MPDVAFTLSGVLKILHEPSPTPGLRVKLTATYENFSATGDGNMAYTLPVDKGLQVAVAYTDANGNPVDLPQGNVSWESSDDALLFVKPDTQDDQKALLMPQGTLGSAQVTCTGKNADGTSVLATLDVTLVAGNAITGTIQPVGEPEDLPHVAPLK